jgi:hypothetical protein
MISQEAINMLLMDDLQHNTEPFTPTKLAPPPTPLMNFKHYAMGMVHPTMGNVISSYKQLMNNPVTANTWQTAFQKDFGSMHQGDNKTGARSTNAMFVMKPKEVDHMPAARLATYANIVVDYQPQKDIPYQIHITAGGNLINYLGELTTRTADIMTSKLHWNSVLSIQQAKYMCLDLKNFYLSVPLDKVEYMRIPISMFPAWIVAQYDLLQKVVKGHIYLDVMGCMGTPPSRDPSKQVTAQTTCASRILQMQTNAGTVETRKTSHIVHPGGRQLWREIH